MSKKKQKKKSYIWLIIVVALILCAGGYYYYNNYAFKQLPEIKKLIDDKKKKGYSDKDDNKIDVSTYVNTLPQERINYNNNDIVARLQVPNLGIDSLVTRASNNEYYLNYNLYRQYDELGVPFIDYRNTSLSTNQQINIYGHNTPNPQYYDQLPFINLEAYVDKGIFDNYKDVYLSIDERQIHYEVIAIKIVTDADNEHMKVVFYGEQDFLSHTGKLLSNTLFKNDQLEITSEDHLLVLQVCHYNPANSYLLVICKEKK